MDNPSIKLELLNYCADVKIGKVVACQKHKWACLRFERDIKREGTELFPYIFVENRAELFINWMREFKHREGVLAGQQIEPNIIQRFIFGNVYGWYHKDTGRRRFKKMYWQVARKNAKSQTLAAVGTFELMVFTNPGRSQVYIAATKTEQAKIVYDEAVSMLKSSDDMQDRYKVAYGRITHPRTDSVFRPLSEEDKKTGDGLNPQCGIIDEYHAHETSEMYDIIDSGMGARPQPLLAIITTAGLDLNNPCYRVEYDLVSKILNPDVGVELDNYFAMVNELDKNETTETIKLENGRDVAPGDILDDIADEKIWEKANPIICSYPEGIEKLRIDLKEAQEAPEKMRNFLTKRMNVWVNMPESGYMDMARWAACYIKERGFCLKNCFVGGDLSSKIDNCSLVFEFAIPDKEKKYWIEHHSFIPSETLSAKIKTDKVPYNLWIQQGWISKIEGARINYRTVMEWGIAKAEKEGWRILEWCLDPWGAAQITADLEALGYTVVEIIQGIKTLSEPTKNFRDEVVARNVMHPGDPVLSWAISNAIVDYVDRNMNIILNKKKSRQRIDPIAAAINAHVRAMVGQKISTYENMNLEDIKNRMGM